MAMEDVVTKNSHAEIADQKPDSGASRKRRLKVRYQKWLVKNVPFYAFIAALAVFYIANGHYADKMVRETAVLKKKVKELEYEYKIVKRDVIFRSKQSELARVVAPLGLEEIKEPPVIIKDTIK